MYRGVHWTGDAIFAEKVLSNYSARSINLSTINWIWSCVKYEPSRVEKTYTFSQLSNGKASKTIEITSKIVRNVLRASRTQFRKNVQAFEKKRRVMQLKNCFIKIHVRVVRCLIAIRLILATNSPNSPEAFASIQSELNTITIDGWECRSIANYALFKVLWRRRIDKENMVIGTS